MDWSICSKFCTWIESGDAETTKWSQFTSDQFQDSRTAQKFKNWKISPILLEVTLIWLKFAKTRTENRDKTSMAAIQSWYDVRKYYPEASKCQNPYLTKFKTARPYWQDAQLSQRDCAAGYISFGRKWKTGTQRQYFTDIVSLASTTVT